MHIRHVAYCRDTSTLPFKSAWIYISTFVLVPFQTDAIHQLLVMLQKQAAIAGDEFYKNSTSKTDVKAKAKARTHLADLEVPRGLQV